jgi:CRISPR/Cas system-associated protein endoribonuclease Cas2
VAVKDALCRKRQFLVAKIVIVRLISVYVKKIKNKYSVENHCTIELLLNIFSITNNIGFSAVCGWCTKPKVKDAKI